MTATQARQHAHRTVDRLARLGLASRGVVYLLVAWLAVRIAFGRSGGQQADRQGALGDIARHPAGKVVLVAMALGFLGYALWRGTQVLRGSPGDDGAKDWGKRAVSGGRGLLYLGFAVTTARTAWTNRSSGGSDQTSRRATSGVLGHTGGRELVFAAGVGFIVGGIVLAIRGMLRKFEKQLRTHEMSERVQHVVAALGVAGQTARGVVFAMIGGFLVDAAVSFDPHKARGLDDSLRSLAHGVWGRTALVLVAVGLAAFGAYSLAESRYRKT